MKKALLIFFLSFFSGFVVRAQEQCTLRISLLTCAPGAELYSTFGHTALRVQDASTGQDLVFNYGTFEFGPDFYVKFIRGKLLYYLSVENMQGFVWQYQAESRSIIEQELNLSCSEKDKLFQTLQVNAREENKYYLYDFLYDNCTTRAGEMVAANTATPVQFGNILNGSSPSFRNQIHTYLDAGHQYWSKLGIDLLLGAKVDKKVTNKEAMFLPDYLMKGFDSARVAGQPLVSEKQTILAMPSALGEKSIFTPFFIFSLLLVLVIGFTIFGSPAAVDALRFFDFLFFFSLGITGCLILFMWVGTDHRVTQSNYNILWALPAHLFAAFFIFKRKSWLIRYFQIVFLLNLLLLAAWFFLPQQMNAGFLPVLLLSVFRSWQLSNKDHGAKRN